MRKYRKLYKRYHQINKSCKIMINRFNKYRQRIRSKKGHYLINTGSLIYYFLQVKDSTNKIIYFKRKIRKIHNEAKRINDENYKNYLYFRFWSSFFTQRNDYNEMYDEEKYKE